MRHGPAPLSVRFHNRFRRLFSPDPLTASLAVYLGANGLIRAIGIGRGILITWLISRADFGTYQLGLLLANLLLPILSLGTHEGLLRFVPQYETEGRLSRFLKSALPVSLLIGAGLCGLLFVLSEMINSVLYDSVDASAHATLTRFVAACVMALIVYHLVLALLRGRRMFRAVSAMELSASALFTIAAVAAALLGHGRGEVILATYTVANIVCAIAFGVPMLLSVRHEEQNNLLPLERNTMGELLRYSIWAGLAALSWQVLLAYPAWHLSRVCGEQVFATFSAMRLITQVAHVAPVAMSAVVFSAVMKTWESAGRERALSQLNLATKAALAMMLVVCFVLASLQGLLVRIFRDEYATGRDAIALLLLSYLLAGTLSFLSIRFALIKKTQCSFAAWVTGSVFAIFASSLWIDAADPQRALLMTAWAGAIGATGALAVVLGYLSYHRLSPDRGTLILLTGIFLLAAPMPWPVVGAAITLLVATTTPLVFSAQERSTILQRAHNLLGLKPPRN